jgi:glycosyltransferase involved in cell wall biosynthesis
MPTALRILHAITSISPLRGGPSVGVRNITEALRRRGIEVDVLTTDDDGPVQRRAIASGAIELLNGQRVRYFPRQTARYQISLPALAWLGRHVREYDVVHTHGLFSFLPLAVAWHARAAGVPYVMRPAGVLDSWGMKNKSARVKMASLRLLEGPLLRGAAAVHFMTDLERERAAHLGLELRGVVVPLGFDFAAEPGGEPGQPRPAAAELEAGDRPVILYLSRLHPVKRVDLLLRAFAGLPQRRELVLAIAGEGEPAFVASLKALAGELGITASVRWLGFAAGARKQRLLAAATVFVLPSASENFGVAVIEAMNAGAPVIVTDAVGISQLVRTAGAGVVTDGTLESLAAALEQLLADAALRATMGRAGQAAVERELSLDAFGARLESLYRSLVSPVALGAPTGCRDGLSP